MNICYDNGITKKTRERESLYIYFSTSLLISIYLCDYVNLIFCYFVLQDYRYQSVTKLTCA